MFNTIIERIFLLFCLSSEIVLYGHDHQRNICKGDKLYINVGSLGCPAQSRNIARAGVVSIKPENIEVQTIDEHYDVSLVVERIDRLHYPDAGNIKKYFYGIWWSNSIRIDNLRKMYVFALF